MNSSTASIQPLQMRGGDRDRGKGLILRSFSPRNMDSLCTRHVVSEGTYFRAVAFSLSFLKRKRDRVMIYRRDGTDPSPSPSSSSLKVKTGLVENRIYTRARAHTLFRHRVKQRNARNAASEWAMVHMGNECSVANGTCPEHPPVQGDPLHWPEAMRRPWNRLRGCVTICCVRT